jgi:hypothetical protein
MVYAPSGDYLIVTDINGRQQYIHKDSIIIDTSITNELQTLSISNDTLSISSGNSVVLPANYNYINGLTLANDTVKLGGNLIANTEINGNFWLRRNIAFNNNAALIVQNTGSASTGVQAEGVATGITSIGGTRGTFAQSTTWPVVANNTNLSNSVVTGVRMSREGIFTAAIGHGVRLDYAGRSSTGSTVNFGSIDGVVTRVTQDSMSGRFDFRLRNDGTFGDRMQLFSNGQLKLNNYGSGTFTGTDAKWLAVTSSGDVIEMNAPSGGGGGDVDTATFLQQDSILIYQVAGVEFGRDTIRVAQVGDNWGSQVVISDTTLVGNGTSGNPLGVDTAQIATHYYISEGFTTKYIDFDTLYANNYQEGRMKWNVDENSVEIGLSPNLSGTALIDDFWYVKNQSGNSIAAGSVVYASGTLGTSGRILIDKYIANGTIDSKYVLGIVAETIPDGEDGYVMTKGKIRGINTSAYVNGTVLWASTAVAGTLTDTVPVAPNFRLPLAFVVHANANGILAVRTTTGSDLYEDHRVQVTTPTTGQLLQYNGTNQRWENWTPNFALSDTSGRNNYLALSNDTLYVGDDNDTLNVLLPYYPNSNPNGYISSFTDTSGYNNYFNLSSQTLSIGDANDTLAVTLPIVGVSAGTGITVNTTSGVATVTNAAPDQTVTISGTGITVGGTYPSFTLTAADQSATNEIQTLSLSNDTLTISSGNSVKLTNAAVLQIVDITVTTDTLELADLGKLVRCNNAGAITLRIPTNANHAFPIGSIVTVEQVGAGVVTIAPVSGVTINPTARKTWGQYSVIQLIKVGTDTWNVVGASS